MADLKKITNCEMNLLIAEKVMGDDICKCSHQHRMVIYPFYRHNTCVTCGLKLAKPFSTDRNAAALVLERAGELNSSSSRPHDHALVRVLENLSEILGIEWNNGSIGVGQLWMFMSASPRQICDAAYLAWEESQ